MKALRGSLKKGQTPFRPEALERLTLDPADAPGPGSAPARPLRLSPSAAERENLFVHAAWRRRAELPAAADATAPDRFSEMFDTHPLTWGGVKDLTQRKLWVAWKPIGASGPGTLCGVKLNHVVHDQRDIPMPDAVTNFHLS